MPDPLVSVVIPMYNAEEWVGETLRSVQSQTIDPELLELIVVDNGSTDRSPEIVRQTAPRCELISLDGNRGPSYARNAGWRRSRAPWIQFLDSDDLLVAGKIDHQLAAAQTSPPDVAAVCSEWQSYILDRKWAPAPPVYSPNLDGDLVQNLLGPANFVHTGSQLFRAAWLDKVGGFDEQLWLIEDIHLQLRLAMAGGRFVSFPAGRPLFYYRRRGSSSLSGSRRLDFLMGCVRNLRLAEDYWAGANLITNERLQFLLNTNEILLRSLAQVDASEFERLLSHILSLSPNWLPKDQPMRILSRIIGYRQAERVSMRYREIKAKLTGG